VQNFLSVESQGTLVGTRGEFWLVGFNSCNYFFRKAQFTPLLGIFILFRCVEKLVTGFRIDGRIIKRGKLVCISVI
jgi:hypothetical protein